MLANAFDDVGKRIAGLGSHDAPTISGAEAETLAKAFSRSIYVDHEEDELSLGMRDSHFKELVYSNGLVWAPDGDEGFDDGSCVLQFDVRDKVRLIGFSRATNPVLDPERLRDVWLPQGDFYGILQNWHKCFSDEWTSLPKLSGPVQ